MLLVRNEHEQRGEGGLAPGDHVQQHGPTPGRDAAQAGHLLVLPDGVDIGAEHGPLKRKMMQPTTTP